MSEPVISLLRIRVVKTFNGGNAEVTNDLPHLHESQVQVAAMQPGNPGSSALGSFTVKLHPPGSEGYAAAKPIYDQLDYFQRLEFYISHDGASLGKLLPGAGGTGIITGIRKSYGQNSVFELTGHPDTVLANLSRPFPGELLSNDVTSAMLKSYLGTNELGWSDTFNPFTLANYTSTNTPGGTSGTWTGTTDDGFSVASCSTGTGAVLLSKSGAGAGDRWHTYYVEATGRLSPSADTTNAGIVVVGYSHSSANTNDGVFGGVEAVKVGTRWNLNSVAVGCTGGVGTSLPVIANVLSNVDDPAGMIPLTIGVLVTMGGGPTASATVCVIINGKVALQSSLGAYDPGTATRYPFIGFGTPATGTATCYLTNLVQMTRFTTDGPSAASVFKTGSISTATDSLMYGTDAGPTFLEAWTRLATREGWYLRYNPQPYVVGTRTLGTVDMAADPGVDRTASVIFSRREGTLINLELTANADAFAADTAAIGQSTLDGGGIGFWRDIGSMVKYGVIQDEVLAFTHSDFNSLRRAAYKIVSNKVSLSSVGAKTAVVSRDPQTADVWRELDRITIDDPELGINNLVCRVVGYTFYEGQGTQSLTLDQFTVDSN